MDFQTLEISFYPEGTGNVAGRMTHFAQFVEKKSTYAFPPDEDFLGIFINLGGHQRYFDGTTSRVFYSHHHTLMHLPRQGYNFILERGFHSWLCLHYTYDDLQGLASDVPMLREFLRNMKYSPSVTMTAQPMPAPYQMLDIIHDMMRNRYTGVSREYYLHMKSLGILAASLMQTLEIHKVHLTARDRLELYALRDLLVNNIKFNYTVTELAEKSGMSEYHLKQRFYSLFGKSVPVYILELRIDKAKELLQDTALSIKDVALMVGYNSASTFVSAFHREVGVAPGGFRGNIDRKHLERKSFDPEMNTHNE